MQHLTYCEAQWSIDVTFWDALREMKVSTWRLDEPDAPLYCSAMRPMSHASTQVIAIDSHSLSYDLCETPCTTSHLVTAKGIIHNYNNLPDLMQADKQAILARVLAIHLIAPLFDTHCSGEEHDEIVRWACAPYLLPCMLTHVDAKNYRFAHTEACATLALRSPLFVQSATTNVADLPFTHTVALAIHAHADTLTHDTVNGVTCPAFFARVDGETLTILPFSPRRQAEVICGEGSAKVYLCVHDVCSAPDSVSWAMRNLLTCLRLAVPRVQKINLYALRDGGVEKSVLFHLTCNALDEQLVHAYLDSVRCFAASRQSRGGSVAMCTAVDPTDTSELSVDELLRVHGWRSKRVATIDLSPTLDVDRRAEVDSRLNLELMRWRVLPDLDLTRLAQCRALVLGVGTLGCAVARHLLMWGVRHLTLVDRGHVSCSNLARQCLFTVDDAKQRRGKAEAGARALQSIMPTINVHPVQLCMPMPGHRVAVDETNVALEGIEQLTALIHTHDVVFLLTDSREARWLPSVIAAAAGTPVINAALGFDTYLVMRHGLVALHSASNAVPPFRAEAEKGCAQTECQLGCYFCSDVIAPNDSMTMRALDQQCTVTRPAVAAIAAALAVEMLAEIYQHPCGFRCEAEDATATTGTSNDHRPAGEAGAGVCRLGIIPHQLRGNLFLHNMQHLRGARSRYCTACSPSILEAYRTEGASFLLRCINDPMLIEQTCGVASLKREWEKATCDIEWEDDDEGGSDSH